MNAFTALPLSRGFFFAILVIVTFVWNKNFVHSEMIVPSAANERDVNSLAAPSRGNPTRLPTFAPSLKPTILPTILPTIAPTVLPTVAPTVPPTLLPTASPTAAPSAAPPAFPTEAPTVFSTEATSAPPVEEVEPVVEEAEGEEEEVEEEVSNVQEPFGQCGGRTWTGPTQCSEGNICISENIHASFCKPCNGPCPVELVPAMTYRRILTQQVKKTKKVVKKTTKAAVVPVAVAIADAMELKTTTTSSASVSPVPVLIRGNLRGSI